MENFEKVELGSLSLDSVSAEDLAIKSRAPRGPRVDFLTAEGNYDFTIEKVTMTSAENIRVDGAGNRWQSARIEAVTEVKGYKKKVVTFIDIPLDSPEYTSKTGSKSLAKTKYLASLLTAATGKKFEPELISNMIGELTGASFNANAFYNGDRVSYHSTLEDGSKLYSIKLKNGGEMTDDAGEMLTFSDRDSAFNDYKMALGKAPIRGLSLASFKPSNGEG